jgi:Lon protease-like protein
MTRAQSGNLLNARPIQIPEKVPVFPLPNSILFPGVDLPLYIFEPRYRKMIADCLQGQKFMAISLLKKGWEENKKEPVPSHAIVGVGYVRAMFENPDGTSHILLKGVGRAEIMRYTQHAPYRIAKVRAIPDEIEEGQELNRLASRLKRLLIQKFRLASEHPHENLKFPREFEDPISLSHLAAFFSEVSPYLKQDLLETTNCNFRIKYLIDILEEEIHPNGARN